MYSLIVSITYALLWVIAPDFADAAVVGFVALLLIPAVYAEHRRLR